MSFLKTPAAFAAACLIAATGAFAQSRPPAPPPAPPAPPMAPMAPASPEATQVVTGTLQRWLINPNGEVDGLLLEDGTQVSFPPHLSAQLVQAVKLKDSLQVTGWRGVNAPVVRASMIKSTSSGRSVVDQPPAPGAAPPAPRDVGSLTAMNASGRIARVLYGPMGEANGALLDSGSLVRFPPHVGAALGANLKVGGSLYARGYGTRNSYGSALEATSIGPTLETARDTFGPPPGPLADARGVPPRAPDGRPAPLRDAGPRARPQPPADGTPPPLDGAPPPAASAPR